MLASSLIQAADGVELPRADAQPTPGGGASTVRVTDHGVPSVNPALEPNQQPRTFLELFSSWVVNEPREQTEPLPPVKVEPKPVQGRVELVVVPEGAERDAIVPIDPAPKIADSAVPVPRLSSARGDLENWASAEPLSVLTMRLVSTSLVTASLWGKSVAAEAKQGDELDRLASSSARRLEQPMVPAPRRLVKRAKPPLKSNRVVTSDDGVDFLTPIEPAAAPAIN